jgi:hypothetical protein
MTKSYCRMDLLPVARPLFLMKLRSGRQNQIDRTQSAGISDIGRVDDLTKADEHASSAKSRRP